MSRSRRSSSRGRGRCPIFSRRTTSTFPTPPDSVRGHGPPVVGGARTRGVPAAATRAEDQRDREKEPPDVGGEPYHPLALADVRSGERYDQSRAKLGTLDA